METTHIGSTNPDFSSLLEVKGYQLITAGGAMHKITLLAASSGSSELIGSNSLHLIQAICTHTPKKYKPS